MPARDKKISTMRLKAMRYLIVGIFLVLAYGVWRLQVIHGDDYSRAAERNLVRSGREASCVECRRTHSDHDSPSNPWSSILHSQLRQAKHDLESRLGLRPYLGHSQRIRKTYLDRFLAKLRQRI